MRALPDRTQSPTTTLVPIDEQPINSPSIIPEPNSTSQPTQYVVMVAVLLGLAAMVYAIAHGVAALTRALPAMEAGTQGQQASASASRPWATRSLRKAR